MRKRGGRWKQRREAERGGCERRETAVATRGDGGGNESRVQIKLD